MSKQSHRKHEAHRSSHPRAIQSIPEQDVFTEHKLFSDVIIALLIFGLGIFFMAPLYSALTAPLQMVCLGVFVLVIGVFVVTHWRKKKSPAVHANLHTAEKVVLLVTIILLSLGIVVQLLLHSLDAWLVGILIVVVLAKLILESTYLRGTRI